jgi:hypothetical protein
MSLRSASLTTMMVLAAWMTPGLAQEKLGDLVASGGYDWIIGRWVAGTDEGQKVEFNFDWALDKHVVLNSLQMGDFKYQGIITLSPTDQEAVDQGVDSRGGTWKGTWSPDGDGLVRKVEHLSPEGQTRKGDIVFGKTDADTITIAIYLTDSSGNRNSEPMSKLTYKRQPAQKAPISAAAGTSDRATDYQKLGDIVASGGYEWLIGKWVGTEKDQAYELEYKPILDKHACAVDLKSGDFKYSGLIMYVASRQEIVEFGVDTMGRIWKGVWDQDGSDAVSKSECTNANGTTMKLQHVFTKIDNDTFKGKLYALAADGSRGAEPREQVTFKRQKLAPQAK